MHQDFSLNPVLDGLHIRHILEILVKFTEAADTDTLVVGFVRNIIADYLAAELMNPDVGSVTHVVLLLCVSSDEIENPVLHFFNKSDQCFHIK